MSLPRAGDPETPGGASASSEPQEPTPIGTPTSEAVTISVSTVFHPAAQLDPAPPDTVLRSSDRVFFHAHRHVILAASANAFASLLADPPPAASAQRPPVLPLDENADLVNVVLHCIYARSFAQFYPSLATLIAAVAALRKYGVPLQQYVAPETPLFIQLVDQAPLHAIEIYMVAAENDLHDLAVAVSPHLLSFHLPTVTDDMAIRMGPMYLKKLFFLHINRAKVLQELMLTPPAPHAPTFECSNDEQQRLTRAWALACATLAWDARPDLSVLTMQTVLSTMEEQLSCILCKESLRGRIEELITAWMNTPRTI
ncbi:hypothetical protein K474DRAFT_1693379 [Panus rudis PR-1116 ss-1]|nr:hypothetical protein K474DRAFT_1693379 [Panus rudis PR-1116 ss-1]